MVWWKAVSNTPICGTSGRIADIAFTPFRLAGLWSGARSLQAVKAASTSGVSRTDSLNFSPPCTIRWPTALISSKDLMAPYSEFVKVFRINSTPTVCSGIFFSRIFFSPLGKVNFRKESFKPIFSIPPWAITSFRSISNNLYLMDELPQFNTKIFILYIRFRSYSAFFLAAIA